MQDTALPHADPAFLLTAGTDVTISHQAMPWLSALDPMIHPESKVFLNSRAVIDACRPHEWMNKFPEIAETSAELRKPALAKLARSFFGLR